MLLAMIYSKKDILHHNIHTHIKLQQKFHEIIHIHVMHFGEKKLISLRKKNTGHNH